MGLPITNHIETERLLLRELNPEVFKHLFTKCTDDEIAAFLNLQSNEELMAEKEKFQKGFTTAWISLCNFQLIEKSSHLIIGACGFHTVYLQHARAEVGYALTDETKKRSGFMTEALKSIIAYGFEVMKFNRIEAFANPENFASVKLLESNGFIYEGLLRSHYFKNGVAEDSGVFGLLKKDWLNNSNL